MRPDRRALILRFGWLAGGLALCLAALLGVGSWLQQRAAPLDVTGDYRLRYTYEDLLEVDGVTYRPRKQLTTILLMGIDQEASSSPARGYRSGGQADFLRLLVIDSQRKQIAQLQLDRDTMTPITILGVLGDPAGTRVTQLALAHGFGDGREMSCELTVEAVSRLLMGVTIDDYAALNLDGIAALNDAVGGVTLTLEEDLSTLDERMIPGATLTLSGAQAELLVHGRRGVGQGTNQERMARQQAYLSALGERLQACLREDSLFLDRIYDALAPYLVTTISKGRLVNEAWFAMDYAQVGPYDLEGVHQVSAEGFMQFTADEASLRQLVLTLFYDSL